MGKTGGGVGTNQYGVRGVSQASQQDAEVLRELAEPDEPVPDAPPLADYQVIGLTRKEYRADPSAPVQPGGTCWHCGQGIMNVVAVRNVRSREEHEIGIDCARRTGLDRAGLRAMLAERYAAERQDGRRSQWRARQAEAQQREAEETARHGAHGTEGRYTSGCVCEQCLAAAPHGTRDRLENGGCTCASCVNGALAFGNYERRDLPVLLDVRTGEVLPARVVSTRYGLRWVVEHANGTTTWYPRRPARRSTLASKGVVEAEAPYLVRVWRNGGFEPVTVLERPTVDAWGEPVADGSRQDVHEVLGDLV
jgi:hypothetical protein